MVKIKEQHVVENLKNISESNKITNVVRNESIQQVSVVAVDTLIVSVSEKDSNNYRKLPEKKLCVLMEKVEQNGIWQVPKTIKLQHENLEDAAYRKVTELLGRERYYIEQLYSFSDSTYSEGTEVNISYLILVPDLNYKHLVSQSTSELQWLEIDFSPMNTSLVAMNDNQMELKDSYELGYEISLKGMKSPEEFAKGIVNLNLNLSVCEPAKSFNINETQNIGTLDCKVLSYGLERLRNKVEYTDLIFYLMPKCFTLTELQQVQELILDEKLYAAHFRRKIEQKLIKCADQVIAYKGHRPAQQYIYNPYWRLKHGKGGL